MKGKGTVMLRRKVREMDDLPRRTGAVLVPLDSPFTAQHLMALRCARLGSGWTDRETCQLRAACLGPEMTRSTRVSLLDVAREACAS